MKYRKLRIAWSMAWGVVAILLCVLWLRSYSYVDSIGGRNVIGMTTATGGQAIALSGPLFSWHGRVFVHDKIGIAPNSDKTQVLPNFMGGLTAIGSIQATPIGPGISLAYWCLAVPAAVLATAPWLPTKRFSLRTLLIATTLVAVVLGLIVLASAH